MKRYLIISQIVYILFMIPWLFVLGMSVMMFDQGFNASSLLIFFAIAIYPLSVIACSIVSWVFRSRKRRLAILINLIPILWVGGIGIPLMVINVF